MSCTISHYQNWDLFTTAWYLLLPGFYESLFFLLLAIWWSDVSQPSLDKITSSIFILDVPHFCDLSLLLFSVPGEPSCSQLTCYARDNILKLIFYFWFITALAECNTVLHCLGTLEAFSWDSVRSQATLAVKLAR